MRENPSLMPRAPFPILWEDNHLLAVIKPAGLATMGVSAEKESLLSLAKQYIKQKYAKPHNVYLGVVSRLDAPVTGVVLLARTSKAAGRLSAQFRTRAVEKTYWALVADVPTPPEAECIDWLRKHERHRKVLITDPDDPGAQQACLSYRAVWAGRHVCLLEIRLDTGRKHQIRVQLAARNLPVLGDRKYGSSVPFVPGIALHARRLTFTHPVRKDRLTLEAPIPESWRGHGVPREI